MHTVAEFSVLLAQVSEGPGSSTGMERSDVIILCILGTVAILVIALIVWILRIMQRILDAVPSKYRTMEPRNVYLLLIPGFNLYWVFRVTSAISRSMKNYYEGIKRPQPGGYGEGVGTAFAVCCLVTLVPVIGWYFLWPVTLISLSAFIAKMNGLRKRLRFDEPEENGTPDVISDADSHMQRVFSDFELLRPAFGPCPRRFTSAPFRLENGRSYHFASSESVQEIYGGSASLHDSTGAPLLILSFGYYARILRDGSILFWGISGRDENKRICFDCFSASSLKSVSERHAKMRAIGPAGLYSIGPLAPVEHWEITPTIKPGVQSLPLPYDWSRFEETLVITDSTNERPRGQRLMAIFAFDWKKKQLEIFPQDWFNNGGDSDDDMLAIDNVCRTATGSIVGLCIRMSNYELDETNRQIKNYIS